MALLRMPAGMRVAIDMRVTIHVRMAADRYGMRSAGVGVHMRNLAAPRMAERVGMALNMRSGGAMPGAAGV